MGTVIVKSATQSSTDIAAAVAPLTPLTQRGAANGVATLDGTTKIPAGQVPDLSGTYARVVGLAAKFDGTDETATVAAALTSAAGGTLWIPPGKTVKCKTISPPSNTRITGGGTIDLIDDGTGTSTSVFVNGVDGVTIDGITVLQSNATGRTGVYGLVRIEGSTHIAVRNCVFGKTSSVFVYVASNITPVQSTDIVIQGNRGSGSYADGIHVCRGASRVKVLNNDLDTTGDDGIAVNPVKADGGTNYVTMTDILVSGNRVHSVSPNGSGISVYGGTRVQVIGNDIVGTPNFGVNVQQIPTGASATFPPVDLVIQGNTISQTPAGSIYLLGQAATHILNAVIQGNVCDPQGATAGHNGIWVQFADGATVTGNRVESGYDGIHLLTVTNSTVSGNSCGGGLGDSAAYLDTCTGVAVTGNAFNGNVGGIYEPNGGPNLLVGNTVRGNTGFQVNSAGTSTVNASNLVV